MMPLEKLMEVPMAKNDSLDKQCKDLVSEVITSMENGVLALRKLNNEIRIDMGVDPNDDLETALKKINEQAAQRYKARKEAEESLSQEDKDLDKDYLFRPLPDILLGSYTESIDSRGEVIEKKGKELGTLYKNSSTGERCSEGGGNLVQEGYPPPLRSSMGLGPNAHHRSITMSNTNHTTSSQISVKDVDDLSTFSTIKLAITTPIKTTLKLSVTTLKVVDAVSSVVYDNSDEISSVADGIIKESINLSKTAVIGMTKLNCELYESLEMDPTEKLETVRERMYEELRRKLQEKKDKEEKK